MPSREYLHFEDSDKLCEYVREQHGDTVLLSFSNGKDSVAAWLQLRRYFKHIIPVYGYLAPDLEFIEEGLRYYEEFFGTRILRLPHPSLYDWLYYCIMQPPDRVDYLIQAVDFTYDWDMLFDMVRFELDLPADTYVATGVRAADSLNRHTAVKRYGAINQTRGTFFPVYDWKKDRLAQEFKEAGVRLPRDYMLFGRSFDGLDYRFVKVLKERLPRDYARIKEIFPMVDLALVQHEWTEEAFLNG